MTFAWSDPNPNSDTLSRLPAWVTARRGDTAEDAAFLSGAALAHLHLALAQAEVPQALLRARLALDAAGACMSFAGRPERAEALRDAVHLLREGDSPGPAGAVYQNWRSAVHRPISTRTLHRACPSAEAAELAGWLAAGHGSPVSRAAAVLEAVLTDRPREEATALILADAALARACGWDHVVPLLARGLARRDLRRIGSELREACHRAICAAAGDVLPLAATLARRAARLRTVAPKLRAKGASEAVELFLTRDALTPADLSVLRSDRAARRFCDRLIELDVVRELTGRDTFRLYGL